MRARRFWLGLLLPACTLTHSLDDLRSGSAAGGSAGSASGSGGSAGGAPAGSSGSGGAATAGSAGSSEAGAAGGDALEGTVLVSTSFDDTGNLGFLEPFELQFNDEMALASLGGNDDSFCKGSLRLSKTGASGCVPLAAATVVDGMPGRYSVKPLEPLEVGESYELLVTRDVTTQSGAPLAEPASVDVTAVYRHTIKIDQTNDFLEQERLLTSAPGYTAFLAWDADALYLGMTGAQIQGDDSNLFLLAYLSWPGATPSSSVAQTYMAITPTLSFDATHYVRWQGTDTEAIISKWQNPGWGEYPFSLFQGEKQRFDDHIELKVPFSAFGQPPTATNGAVNLVMFLLKETTGSENTYAAAPGPVSGSVTAPQLVKHYALNVLDSLNFPSESPIVD